MTYALKNLWQVGYYGGHLFRFPPREYQRGYALVKKQKICSASQHPPFAITF